MLGKNRQKKATIDTLIGAGTTVIGDVAFRGGLHVDGEIRGNVVGQNDSPTLFSIAGDGRIEGSVDASEVIVNGAVDGDVIARDRVELGPTARVTGNVIYGLIQMAIGAEVNGIGGAPPGTLSHHAIWKGRYSMCPTSGCRPDLAARH